MNIDGKKLRAYVERWQRLEEHKAEAAEDQKALLDDMEKNDNIERKPFKTLIRYLKDEEVARVQLRKFEELLATYLDFGNTPLGKVAERGEVREMTEKMTVTFGDGKETVISGTVADIKDAIAQVRRKSQA